MAPQKLEGKPLLTRDSWKIDVHEWAKIRIITPTEVVARYPNLEYKTVNRWFQQHQGRYFKRSPQGGWKGIGPRFVPGDPITDRKTWIHYFLLLNGPHTAADLAAAATTLYPSACLSAIRVAALMKRHSNIQPVPSEDKWGKTVWRAVL